LDEFIDEIKNDLNLYSNEMLTELGYYISIEIFIQILNGVNYLHEHNKPIIHRDLRPDNIMLKIDKKSKSTVKIADLGLAKLHELNQMNIKHTQDRGHIKYIAPEVENSKDYDTRADIFSLGKVLENMFDINVNRYYKSIFH
jgi:serine/threonine protein kinase